MGGLYTELLYVIIPTLFLYFLPFCYPYILLHFYQLAAREAHSRLVLRLLCSFRICRYIYLYIRTYHVSNNYVTYIVAMRPSVNFGNLDSSSVV